MAPYHFISMNKVKTMQNFILFYFILFIYFIVFQAYLKRVAKISEPALLYTGASEYYSRF